MFPRSLRLGRQGFEKARGLSRTATAHFSISYGRYPSVAGAGVIVPKKVVKGAVDRHHLKRRIRECMRSWLQPGMVLIVSAKKDADTLTFAQIQDELSTAFRDILAETH
jgi:ribonuclease P protein component